MTEISLQAGRYNSCDEWCEAAEGWNLRFLQLDKGALDAEMVRVLTPDLVMQKVSVSRRLHQSGSAPDGLLTFGFPLEPHLHRWLGRDLTATSILNFGRNGGYDSISQPGFHGQTISVQTESFLTDCAAIGARKSPQQILARAEEFVVSPGMHSRILRLESALLRCANAGVSAQQGALELASDIRYLIALAISDTEPEVPALSAQARHRSVDRALEIIHANNGQISIPQVCQYAATSARNLSRAFRERFGISTKQYMVATRLSNTRRALKLGGVTVTDAANRFGFWHLGQFSADYRAMFGELPSETLRKR